MRLVYVLHGIGGGELCESANGTDVVWANFTQLALGRFGKLRLDSDGVTPGSPDGVQLYPGHPLPDYYAAPIRLLRDQVAGDGYDVCGYGYDWRLDVRGPAALLADRLRQEATLSEPATIVAHSLGGLVARCCWRLLVASGDTGLLRRIVTLGTPHQGSYAIVALWSDDDDIPEQMYRVTVGVTVFSLIPPLPITTRVWTPLMTMKLSATWPSCYQCLPTMQGVDGQDDPNRSVLFTQSNWPSGLDIDQVRLTDAASSWQPFLQSSPTLPPAWVMTTVAGFGIPTPFVLTRPSRLGDSAAYDHTEDGDGKVTTSSALLAGSAQYRLASRHGGLLLDSVLSGELARWIRDERAAPSPAPPLVSLLGELRGTLNGPPLALLFQTGADP